MSFDTVKNGIVTRLQGLGYTESLQAVDFKNAPANEYGNCFILKPLSGAMDEVESETMVDRFYDVQEWQVQIAFDKSAQNDIVNRDDLHRKKDLILKDLDNPANWSSFVRILKYKSWEVGEFENYFILTIKLKIVDTYTY
jgi:hypothetical protein